MANKRISFDEEAPKISEPLVRVSDDFVTPYAEPVARPQDDPLVRMGQALSGLSSSLELYAKATEPERIEADKTAAREWADMSPEQQQDAVKEGQFTASQYDFIWRQEGANAAKELERRANRRFAEATDWNNPEQASVIWDEERAAILENLPEHLKNNAIYLNQLDESSHESRERFKTRASTKAEERRVTDGLVVAETGMVNGLGDILEASDGTDPEDLEARIWKVVTDSMDTIHEVYGADLGQGEQQKIMNRVFTAVVDRLLESDRLEDLEELKTFMETLEESKPKGFTGFADAVTAKIDDAIRVGEARRYSQDGKNERQLELNNAASSTVGILSDAKIAYLTEGTELKLGDVQAQVDDILGDKFSQAVKKHIANQIVIDWVAYKNAEDTRKLTATNQEQKAREESGRVIANNAVSDFKLFGLEVALNRLAEKEHEMPPDMYAGTRASLLKLADSYEVVERVIDSYSLYESESSEAYGNALLTDMASDDYNLSRRAGRDWTTTNRMRSAIIASVTEEHFKLVYNEEEGTWSYPDDTGLKAKIDAELEKQFAPLLEQYEAEARATEVPEPQEVGALIDTGTEGFDVDAQKPHRAVGHLQKTKEDFTANPTKEGRDQLQGAARNVAQKVYTSFARNGVLMGRETATLVIAEKHTNARRVEHGRVGPNGQFQYGVGYLTPDGDRNFLWTTGANAGQPITSDNASLNYGPLLSPFKVDEEKTEKVLNDIVSALRIDGLKVAPTGEDQAAFEEGGAFVKDGRVFMTMGKDDEDNHVFVPLPEKHAMVLTDPGKTLMLPVGITDAEVEAMLTQAKEEYDDWLKTDMGQRYNAYLNHRGGFKRGDTFGPWQFIGVAVQLNRRLSNLDTSGVSRQAPVQRPPR